MKLHRTLAAAAAAVLSLGLAACISVFPKAPPVTMYAFGGGSAPAQTAPAPGGAGVNILRTYTSFPAAAGGDRILTLNGQQAAYIAGSRWVSPASALFDQATTRAFDANPGPARLIQRGEMAHAAAELRLDVEAFEVRYPGSLNAAPTVVVRVRAILTGLDGRNSIDAQTFESRQTTGNRVGEIVRGFDTATGDVLKQLVTWTNQEAARLPPQT